MKTFFISFILFIGLAFALPIESGNSPLGGLPVIGGLLGGNGDSSLGGLPVVGGLLGGSGSSGSPGVGDIAGSIVPALTSLVGTLTNALSRVLSLLTSVGGNGALSSVTDVLDGVTNSAGDIVGALGDKI
ncbi:hypothetical protein TrVFT333_007150 [Trichoderma virens FT-333]|nr:hypothetical protein TrVFT333_007150 [Trichoderma virens FT-333]